MSSNPADIFFSRFRIPLPHRKRLIVFKINFQNNVHPLKKIKPSFIYIFWSIIDWIIDWRLYTCNWWKYSDNDYVLLSTLKLTGVPYHLKDYLGFPFRKITIICWTKLTWSEIKLSDCPDLFMSDLKPNMYHPQTNAPLHAGMNFVI